MATGSIGRARFPADAAVKIKGNTDDTLIGNEGDRLKVTATNDSAPSQKIIHFVNKLLNAGSDDMTVNGSGTPVVFESGPPAGQTWYVFEYGIAIDDSGNNTLDTFGAIANGLTNGLLIQQEISSTDYEFAVLKNNLEIVETFTDHFIRGQSNAYLNASNFFAGKVELREAVTLIGDNGDKIKVTVRDNLTGLNTLQFTIEGFRVI